MGYQAGCAVMTSRATGMRPNSPGRWWTKKIVEGRDFPDDAPFGARKAVCRRCKLIMSDIEPMITNGEFHHGAKPHQTRALACVNNGTTFDLRSPELEPFLRKRRRRLLKRLGIRA